MNNYSRFQRDLFQSNLKEARDSLLSRKEAAYILKVKPQTLAVWACTGRYDLPFIKVGSRVFYRREDLESFLRINTYSQTQ